MEELLNILVVDSNQETALRLASDISGEKFSITMAHDEQEAIQCCHQKEFCLVIVDLKLSEPIVFDLIKYFRKVQPSMAVIIIADQANINFMIQAIRYGVSDFLLRPFENDFMLERLEENIYKQQQQKQIEDCLKHYHELLKKLAAIEADETLESKDEHNPTVKRQQILQVGNFVLDMETRQVFVDGLYEFHLTTTNFNYLKVLVQHAPRAVSFTTLVKEAQGYDLSKQEAKSLAFWHIYKLRKELANGLEKNLIQNIRGYGYNLLLDGNQMEMNKDGG